MKTNKKGISLIVLAITIVVMIILATAIILSLSGKDVIATAKEAATASDMANVKHVVSVAKGEWELGEVENYTTFEDYAKAKVQAAGYKVSGTGAIHVSKKGGVSRVYQDAAGYTALIPEGYTASEAKGEDTIANGLVIYEGYEAVTDRNLKEAQETRNQFVWVPVAAGSFNKIAWGVGLDASQTISCNVSDVSETEEYAAMYNSVRENGGFYIARYEAGTDVVRTSTSGSTEVLIQKNKSIYNFVSRIQAKEICQELGSDSAGGHLIYGEEWDAALFFISQYGIKDGTYPTNSDGKGNFTSIAKTGSKAEYALNNIYDMAGNAYDLTSDLVSTATNTTILRGGNVLNTGSSRAASIRTAGASVSQGGEAIGFRAALYIK